MNIKSKSLERLALGTAAMFGSYWLYTILSGKLFTLSPAADKALALASLYILGLGLMLVIINKLPVKKAEKRRMAAKQLFGCFLLQFSALFLMSILINLAGLAGLGDSSAQIDTLSPYTLFMLLVFNPIAEEFVFRKLFADRLLQYGESVYILSSAFCFAIVHGFSLGLPQVLYTFILGLIWAFVMARTGRFVLVVLLHAASNLFGSIMLQWLMKVSIPAAGIYSVAIMVTGAVSLCVFLSRRKRLQTNGEPGLIRKEALKELLSNRGILAYSALTLAAIAVKWL